MDAFPGIPSCSVSMAEAKQKTLRPEDLRVWMKPLAVTLLLRPVPGAVACPANPWRVAHRRSRCASTHRLIAALRPALTCKPCSNRSLQEERKVKGRPLAGTAFFFEAPGSDLLSHGLSHTTIGAGAFHFRVRDGIGWDHAAVIAEQPFGVAR